MRSRSRGNTAVLVERGVRWNANANSFQHAAVSGRGGGALEGCAANKPDQHGELSSSLTEVHNWERSLPGRLDRPAGASKR